MKIFNEKNIFRIVIGMIILIGLIGSVESVAINNKDSLSSPPDRSDVLISNGGVDNSIIEESQSTNMIKAVVLKSWSGCGSGSVVWDDLNTDWAKYGSTPIHVYYSYPGLCDGPITYANLVSSRADIIIISDPSGGLQQYSLAEINAIRQYAMDGHNVIGTYALF